MSETPVIHPEQVPAIQYSFEYAIDPIRGYTGKSIEIFVEAPYNFTALYGTRGIWNGKELFISRAMEAKKTQTPTFDKSEPITDHEKIMVSKEWADNCLKILNLEEETKGLTADAVKNMPDVLRKELTH